MSNKSEDNSGLFEEQANKLFEACGNMSDWLNGYVERLAKNVFAMSIDKKNFPDVNENLFNMVWNNYLHRKTKLIVDGKIPDPYVLLKIQGVC